MRYYTSDGTNCLQCCMANMYDLRLEDTINVYGMDPKIWWEHYTAWCVSELGMFPIRVKPEEPLPRGLIYILVGTLTEDRPHAVLGCNEKCLFDPNVEVSAWTDMLYKIVFLPATPEVPNEQG